MLAPCTFKSLHPSLNSSYSNPTSPPSSSPIILLASSLSPECWMSHPSSLYGYSIFETLRTYQGHILRCKTHLLRLQKAASLLGWVSPPLDEIQETLKHFYQTLLHLNHEGSSS